MVMCQKPIPRMGNHMVLKHTLDYKKKGQLVQLIPDNNGSISPLFSNFKAVYVYMSKLLLVSIINLLEYSSKHYIQQIK